MRMRAMIGIFCALIGILGVPEAFQYCWFSRFFRLYIPYSRID
jgi:hypothetical protein